MTEQKRLKVGAVSYLNTKPLVFRLAETVPDVDLVFDLPSRLADGLACGRFDVALIPSVEYLLDSRYEVVSDACIACRGAVLSVKLLSRVPMAEIKTLSLDEGSRTSVAMVRVLLHERFGLRPECVPLPIGAAAGDVESDAVLLIGDRAIHASDDEFTEVWDLGDEWCRWSELPFVFAMWTSLAGTIPETVRLALEQARNAGVEHLAEIAERESASVGLSAATCLSYLRDNLHFHLGDRERRGLQLFQSHAATLGLVPSGVEPVVQMK